MKPGIAKYEISDRHAVLYVDKIPSAHELCFNLELTRDFEVGIVQPVPVTVYDYYEPGQCVFLICTNCSWIDNVLTINKCLYKFDRSLLKKLKTFSITSHLSFLIFQTTNVQSSMDPNQTVF